MTALLTVSLGELLTLMRHRAGLTQGELGAIIELGRTTVIRWEADLGSPRKRDIEAWSEACDAADDLAAAATSAWEERTLGCYFDQLALWSNDRVEYAARNHPPPKEAVVPIGSDCIDLRDIA